MNVETRVDKGRIKVGDRWASLLSGSVHYWRLHPGSWEQVLSAVKELGLETIASYVPWEFHEIEKNVFDFAGGTDSRRDLAGFLQMAKDMGLWFIVRPGPFIYSEWVNMGVPTDVAQYHRLHPEFTARAANYIREVSKVIAPFQATRGGHVIMLQPDNEADTFEYCYEEQLGLGDKAALFQEFLREKYGDIERLNVRWGTELASFDQARAVMSYVELEPAYHLRYLDFVEFRADYINNCVAHYAEEYRRNGIDVPLFHNTYDSLSVQDFRALSEVVDLVGVDAYPSNEFLHKAFASGEEVSHRQLLDIFRYLRTFSETAYIAEYESGIAHGLHYYSDVLWPNHCIMTNLTAMQAGIHAWNWYMLVNRDNWMMSPINEWGRKQRELFRVYAEVVQMYKRMKVPALEKVTDTSALFYLKHQMTHEASIEPTLTAIYGAGVDYELYNVETGQVEKPLLFYAGPNWLDPAFQERLAEYVERGGHLVFFQTFPLYDEDFNKANVLGLVRPDRVTNEPFLDHLATETEVDLGGHLTRTRAPFYVYDGETPGEPIYGTRVDADIRDADFEENQYLRSLVIGHRYQIGYHEKRGKGSITVVGVRPSPSFVTALHKSLNVPIAIYSHAPAVKPALFRRDDTYYAVLINMGNYPVNASLDIAPDLLASGDYVASSLRESIEVDDSELSQGRIYVKLPRKNGTVVEICKT